MELPNIPPPSSPKLDHSPAQPRERERERERAWGNQIAFFDISTTTVASPKRGGACFLIDLGSSSLPRLFTGGCRQAALAATRNEPLRQRLRKQWRSQRRPGEEKSEVPKNRRDASEAQNGRRRRNVYDGVPVYHPPPPSGAVSRARLLDNQERGCQLPNDIDFRKALGEMFAT